MVMLLFEVFGDTQIARNLERFAGRTRAPEPAWAEMITAIKHSIEDNFDSEGASSSGGWAPLKPATLANKERLGQRSEILRATDALKNALTGEVGTDHQIYEVDPEGFTFGTNLPYARFHQTGAPAINLPVRKPVEFSLTEREEFVKILQRWMIEGTFL